MTPDRVALAAEYLAGARKQKVTELPPSVLVRECQELRRQLGQVLAAIGGTLDGDGTEPYCTTCGQWVGMFHGIEGWRHFRGDPAPGGKRELYEAGHEPVIGWTVPPGRALSPGQMATVRGALADAADLLEHRAGQWCGECETAPDDCCPEHAADLDQADAYRAVAREVGGDQ